MFVKTVAPVILDLNLEEALMRLGLYSHDPLKSHLTKTSFNGYEFSAYKLLNETTDGKLNSNYHYMSGDWSSALPSSENTDSLFIIESRTHKNAYYLNSESLTGEPNYRYNKEPKWKTYSLKKLIKAVEESLLLLENRLLQNGIQPSLDRAINLWMLTNHLASDCSVIKHGRLSKISKHGDSKYKEKAIKRVYELIEGDIKPYLALQSLTLVANKNFYTHDEFEWSIESLKHVNDFPLLYLNKLLLDLD